ncbi:hypothetical protein [Bacillus suaedae]|uniref:Uncharacterized protein n=1 Tax=Halalkalibacter suaedae TaxID=2822140 RepID=A0A940WW59_9BACI|nr:hypothetical protein [Bacillus suaedae]MBP3952808.1 hypothetical protein [Bacillus suaedae]
MKLIIEPSQSSLLEEKPKDNHEGIEYTVDVTSGVEVKKKEETADPETEDMLAAARETDEEMDDESMWDDDDLPN